MTARLAKILVLFPLLVSLIGGCVVVARPARPCPGGIWIEGHNDRFGRWHPAHWRCPGVVEEEVIIR
jgi:hypothetical protein